MINFIKFKNVFTFGTLFSILDMGFGWQTFNN